MPVPIPTTPLGTYVELESTQAARPIPILADYIDPVTGDITRLLESRTPVDGGLIEGFRVERGTGPAVMNVGQTLRKIRHTDASSLGELKERARDGVRALEQAGLVRLKEVKHTLEGQRDFVSLTAQVQDLTLAQNDPNAIRDYPVTLPRG